MKNKFSKGIEIIDKGCINEQIWEQTHWETDDKIWGQVRDQAWRQTYNQINWQINKEIYEK